MTGGGQQGAPGFEGGRVRAARQAARLTQRQVADRLGVHFTVVANWEAGRRIPRVDRLGELARQLGVRPAELTSAADDTGPPSLRHLRVGAGLLQEHVADRTRMSRQKYAALERGEIATLGDADARALAGTLGVGRDEVRTAQAVSRAAFLAR